MKTSNATITESDVKSCISNIRKSLEDQRDTAKKRFEELRTRKINDMKEQQKETYDNLIASIQNEKNVLSKLKQSAIQDNYDVTACNDSSNILDLILTSAQASSNTILAEYKSIVDRGHTQTSLQVDKFAQKYQQLEKQLSNCQSQSQNSDCLDKVEDECEIFGYQNEIYDLQSTYYGEAEKNFIYYKVKISTSFQKKMEEVKFFSNDMKSCYRSVKNINSTPTNDVGDSGVSFQPHKLLVLVPIVYKLLF